MNCEVTRNRSRTTSTVSSTAPGGYSGVGPEDSTEQHLAAARTASWISRASGKSTERALDPMRQWYFGLDRRTDDAMVHCRDGSRATADASTQPAVFALQLRRRPQTRRAIPPTRGNYAELP